MATTPQQEEYRAKENLASILRNLRAMPVKDCLGMIAELFEEESAKPGVDQQLFHTNEAGAWQRSKTSNPVQIRVCQVGSIKPMTKEQLWKCLWQHSAEEWKEIGLLFRQSSKSQEMTALAQIHMLQIARPQGGLPKAQIWALKIGPITKKQVKKNLQRHDWKEQKEIALETLKNVLE